MTPRDITNHRIAETIGCSVHEVLSLGIGEYKNWVRYFRWKNNELQTDEELAEALTIWRQ